MESPTVDQILQALAVVESSNNPDAWGDGGRALGRWQVHPDRLWYEAHREGLQPSLGETWDSFVGRVLRAMIVRCIRAGHTAAQIAMYWHLGHYVESVDTDWDQRYAVRFTAALESAAGAA